MKSVNNIQNSNLFLNLFRFIRDILNPSMRKYLEKELDGCTSFLDLGCGKNSPISQILDKSKNKSYVIGVDIFRSALKDNRQNETHDEYILGDLTKIEFKPNSFDAIICISLLEHLSKNDGLILIDKMKKWAKKKIIIAVPNGNIHQDAYDGNPYQIHVSSWEVKDFKDQDFQVHGCHGYRALRGECNLIKFRPIPFWLIISDITQKATYYVPKYAATLLAIKNI